MLARESPFVGVTADNSLKSRVKVTVPSLPPPDNPTPAETPCINPCPPGTTIIRSPSLILHLPLRYKNVL